MKESHVYVQKSDSPVRGARVMLSFGGIIGTTSDTVFTDGNGLARIAHRSSATATVYVNGEKKSSFSAPGTVTVRL